MAACFTLIFFFQRLLIRLFSSGKLFLLEYLGKFY